MNLKQKLVFTCCIAMATIANAQQPVYLDAKQPVQKRVQDLLKQMTLEEKVAQMCQYVGIEHQIESYTKNKGKEPAANDDASTFYKGISFDSLRNMVVNGRVGSFLHIVTAKESNEMQKLAMQSRLKIPILIGIDAIHGNALVNGCTVYPTPLTMAASFNPSLVEKISVETAKEMRATGSHWTFTPNIDIARDARWGRVGETFGEDTYLVSALGVAMVKGLQGKNMTGKESVVSCIKHLIGGGNSVNGLNGSPTDISDRTLWEVHLPPYKAGVDAGAFSVMTAHNELNGVPCHANKYLMTDVLRSKWGFKGFYVSDWMDIERLNTVHHVAPNQKEAVYQTIMAGMDMHMHGPNFLEPLVELVKEGRIPVSYIDKSAAKILESKFKLGLFENPYVDESLAAKVMNNSYAQSLALQSAREGIVLLKNDSVNGKPFLPLSNKAMKILVTGPNANNQTMLGDWSLLQPDENVITAYEGIKQIAPAGSNVEVFETGTVKKIEEATITEAANKAKDVDVVVVVVGENSLRYQNKEKTSGENIDRDNIILIGQQNQLIKALEKSGKPVIVVLVNSRPLAVGEITKNTPALIEAWEPGNFGGQALAEIIFGKYNPSGKLPMSIPRSVGQVPTYYNYKPSNYFHKYIETQSSALYPFGFGLSYTNFAYDNIVLSKSSINKNESIQVTATVTNTGNVDGEDVVQLYIRDEVSSVTRPVKELKGFQKASLKAGASQKITFTVTPKELEFLDINMKPIVEAGEFTIMVGNSSNDKDLKKVKLTVK
jgi:beta-glucosidase